MSEPALHQDGNATTCRDHAFWRARGGVGLVWSNRNASDSVMIANALLEPDFHLLLDIAEKFGLSQLKLEWDVLRNGIEENGFPEELRKLRRATPTVERCIENMEAALR